MKKITSRFAALFVGAALLGHAFPVSAEETTGDKVNQAAGDAKKSVKKHYRSAKKNVRDATGNHSTKEDVKEGAQNMGDSLDSTASDVKKKVD